MLSAVTQKLHNLRKINFIPDLWLSTVDLCAAAYPDLQPWQVQNVCCGASAPNKMTKQLEDLYYIYLSLLLHPIDGHESARRNPALVKVRY